jgi:leader peptidase (prepilin peptidase)/N-methyltransferase
MSPIDLLFSQSPLIFYIFIVVLGLIVGSFLNVVIFRIPVMLEREWKKHCAETTGQTAVYAETPFNLVSPRSQCRHCGRLIRVRENIPVLSFLFLKGKCANCRAPISWRYPAVELLTALLSVTVAVHYGYGTKAAAAMVFVWALVALTFIDYDTQLLPDNITLPLLWAGLLVNLNGTFASLSSAVIGAVAGYLFLWLVYHAFKKITGKEGMGYGDFKLFAAFGAWLGWQQLPFIILLSSFVGAVVGLVFIAFFGRDRSLPIPFGPFLCVAGFVALLWGEQITHAYLRYARFA